MVLEDLHVNDVYYGKYCRSCKYRDRDSDEDPCLECLAEKFNSWSNKPIKYEENK